MIIYMGIGFALSLIMPFPLSIGVLVLVIFPVNIIRTEIALRKAGMGGIRRSYRSFSSLGHSSDLRNSLVYTPLKFYCMNCGYEHRKIACPKCGSKAVRAA
jgi:hypothetical protein